jgi:hypothetical protein
MHWDDVVCNPISNLPHVISPSKKVDSVQNEIDEMNVVS